MRAVSASATSPLRVAAFRGRVTCSRTPHALILAGPAADAGEERLILTLATAGSPGSPDLPECLADAAVLRLEGQRYRIDSGSREWVLDVSAVHVHRDVGSAFYRAVPPRRAPLRKRLFWRAVLALAHTSIGKRLLLAIRRK